MSEQDSVIYETDRLTLRGLRISDLEGRYFNWFDDQEVCRYNSHGLFPNTRAQMEEFMRSLDGSTERIVWAIVEKKGGRHIGNVSLQSIDWVNRSAEFAVLIGEKDCWGKGYAAEAANLLFRHAFEKLNLNRIYCGTAAANTGMRRLAEKLRMRHEGTRRQALFLEGQFVDLHEYGVLRDEFLA